ncbi:hypothetical protein G7Y89_g8058 [Cudoniella acicularis]|uniref:Uncharacterized protein n=1 Tax=Cudoniella acicularis TaxID=354080 RepID=A0A8H4RIV4_9HELO|nr:hypothetical protein G7Y89_g8058 [Cudoniella acicularis]
MAQAFGSVVESLPLPMDGNKHLHAAVRTPYFEGAFLELAKHTADPTTPTLKFLISRLQYNLPTKQTSCHTKPINIPHHYKTASESSPENRNSLETMSTVEAPPAATRNRPPRHRRGRGGNRGNALAGPAAPHNPDASLALRPASVAPESTQSPAPTSNAGRGNRSRRGGLGRGGRPGGAHPPMVNGVRSFGGQLTSNTPPPPPSADGSLAADAPVFVPGQPVVPRARAPQAPRQRRMSKSQAPDIATRTHEDIANRQYECVICTNEVLTNSKIWTCKTCWSLGFLLIPAAKPVRNQEQDIAHTLVNSFVTQVLVLHVLTWDQLYPAFAGRRNLPGDARIPITIMDGVAGRFVVTFFHVENTLVSETVTKDYAAVAKF